MKWRLFKWSLVCLVVFCFLPSFFSKAHTENLYQDQVAVLTYHHISDTIQGDVTISTKRFADQLKDLLQRGYHFITLDQFKSFLKGAAVPPNAVLVTFDDGYQSFYTNAYPILHKFNIPAVNFVITKDLENPMASRIPSLSRDEISQMTKLVPTMDFQCHSDSLHNLGSDGKPLLTSKLNGNGHEETNNEYNQRIIQDTNMCINKLKVLSTSPVDTFAYPFGTYDSNSIKLLQQAGITYGFTTVSKIATRDADLMKIPRINAGSPFIKSNSLNNLILQKIYRSI